MLSSLKAVVFDLDGTLVNTVPDVRLALNQALALYCSRQIKQDEIYELIGHGARYMIQKAFEMANVSLTDIEIQRAQDYYLECYKKNPVVETIIYPHVVEVLCELKKMNLKLAICTNKPAVMTNIVLEKLQLKHFFEVISSGDEMKNAKPHPEHLSYILSKMQTRANEVVMIGDSEVDKATADNLDVAFVGVSYGYSAQLKADRMISDMKDLLSILVAEPMENT
jgi:phosphoglycolate phosphatase